MFTLQVFVRDNNVDQALRVLKKKMQREGVFREMKRRRFYEKPSEMTTRKKAEAVRRARKLARKKAQREGLIAAPAQKRAAPGTATGRPRSNTQSLVRSDLPDVRSVRTAAPLPPDSAEPLR